MPNLETRAIYGPPGCGKTTELIATIKEWVAEGIEPSQIGVMSFTKAAATEMAKRANVPVEIGTLHSFAFRLAGIQREQVVGREHFAELSELCGIETRGEKRDLEDDSKKAEGDAYLALAGYMGAVQQTDPSAAYLSSPCEGELNRFVYWYKSYNEFKKQRGLVDFNDMLLMAMDQDPEVDYLILDEAQDFSPLQWALLDSFLPYVKRVYLAGDDDQAIYKWGGADPEGMAKFEFAYGSERKVLNQSWRLPPPVHALAVDLIHNITNRVDKQYDPIQREGEQGVYHYGSAAQLSRRLRDLSAQDDVLILVRNHAQREDIEEWLIRQGIPYRANGGFPAPLQNRWAKAITLWRRAQANFRHTGDFMMTDKDLESIGRSLRSQYRRAWIENPDVLIAKNWGQVLDIPAWRGWPSYYQRVLAKYATVEVNSNVRISTIHGAKGHEADHVILINGMSERTMETYLDDPDSEIRTFYVGVTRARKCLHIVTEDNPLPELVAQMSATA